MAKRLWTNNPKSWQALEAEFEREDKAIREALNKLTDLEE